MEIRPIRTEVDYQEALKEVERLFDAAPNTPEFDRLDILSTLVEAYEQIAYPIDLPDPIEAIQYYMEARGWSRRELESCIGSRARVSEILSRKRSLTLEMIRKLHQQLGIPAEVLIRPYRKNGFKTPVSSSTRTASCSKLYFEQLAQWNPRLTTLIPH